MLREPVRDRAFQRLDSRRGRGQRLVPFADAVLELAEHRFEVRDAPGQVRCPLLPALGVAGALGEQLLEMGDLLGQLGAGRVVLGDSPPGRGQLAIDVGAGAVRVREACLEAGRVPLQLLQLGARVVALGAVQLDTRTQRLDLVVGVPERAFELVPPGNGVVALRRPLVDLGRRTLRGLLGTRQVGANRVQLGACILCVALRRLASFQDRGQLRAYLLELGMPAFRARVSALAGELMIRVGRVIWRGRWGFGLVDHVDRRFLLERGCVLYRTHALRKRWCVFN